MKKFLAFIVFLLLLAGVALAVMYKLNIPIPQLWGTPIACTTEAKVCPDGSSVGRTGPKCEFAECPSFIPTGPENTTFIEAQIGQSIIGFNATVTPMAVIEDSRCPVDVQCIQVGTVRLQAQLTYAASSSIVVFKLGEPITANSLSFTLAQVSPAPYAGKKITPDDYIFGFQVEKI